MFLLCQRLTPEVMVSWNKAYIEFEADYHELILQDMQDTSGYFSQCIYEKRLHSLTIQSRHPLESA